MVESFSKVIRRVFTRSNVQLIRFDEVLNFSFDLLGFCFVVQESNFKSAMDKVINLHHHFVLCGVDDFSFQIWITLVDPLLILWLRLDQFSNIKTPNAISLDKVLCYIFLERVVIDELVSVEFNVLLMIDNKDIRTFSEASNQSQVLSLAFVCILWKSYSFL